MGIICWFQTNNTCPSSERKRDKIEVDKRPFLMSFHIRYDDDNLDVRKRNQGEKEYLNILDAQNYKH